MGPASPRPIVRAYKAGGEKKETPSIFPVKAERKEVQETANAEATPAATEEALPEAGQPTSPPTRDYSQQDVDETWRKFIESKQSVGLSDSLRMIFKRSLLKKENNAVEIELSTDIERKFLKVEETALVQFLRKELGNPYVTLLITMKEAEMRQRLYTDKEKFNYLAEKQPLLLKLKEKLFLDTDF